MKTTEYDLSRLQEAIKKAETRDLSWARQRRKEGIDYFAGPYYGDRDVRPVEAYNYIRMGVEIYRRNLTRGVPQVYVTTLHDELKPTAAKLQGAVNQYAKKLRLHEVLRATVTDAMFMLGIVRVGINPDYDLAGKGLEPIQVGEPYVERISFDNFVFDTRAASWDRVAFMGDAMWLRRSQVAATKGYNKKAVEELSQIGAPDQTGSGDPSVSSLSREMQEPLDDSGDPFIKIWNVFMPRANGGKGRILIFADRARCPLREMEWEGPASGPYCILSLGAIPDNLLPSAIVPSWFDLQSVIAQLSSKVFDGAVNQKTIFAVQAGNEKEAETIRNVADRSLVSLQNPTMVQPISFPGADPGTERALANVLVQADIQMGNLSTLGGLSAAADTLGQEQMLKSSANQAIQEIQQLTTEWIRDIMQAIAFHLFYNPMTDVPFMRTIHGLELTTLDRFEGGKAKGDFLDFNFDVEASALGLRSPASDLANLRMFLAQDLPMLMPLLEQQGATINVRALIGKIADLSGLEVDEFISDIKRPPVEPIVRDGGGKPAAKRTDIVRHSAASRQSPFVSMAKEAPQTSREG